MIRRRALVGLSLLSALLFCAFAAQNALATKSVNTTAFTCVKVAPGTGGFTDAHCDKASSGEFAHQSIPLSTTTEVAATNQKVTNSTNDSEPATLKTIIGLTQVHIDCNIVSAIPTKSVIHSVETDGKHTVTGDVALEYSTCTVTKPAKCHIKEPVVAEATFEGAEGLGPGGNEMGMTFIGKGTQEAFVEIHFTGPECALKEKTFKVKGSVIGTSGPTTESAQTNKGSGATAVFTPKNEMQKLVVATQPAEFTSIVTPSMSGGGSPLTLTTVT